jgi:hypothetical protein
MGGCGNRGAVSRTCGQTDAGSSLRAQRGSLRRARGAVIDTGSARELVVSGNHPRRCGHRCSNRCVALWRRIRALASTFHIRELVSQRRNPADCNLIGDHSHERMCHTGSRAVREHQTGASAARSLHQSGDAGDLIDGDGYGLGSRWIRRATVHDSFSIALKCPQHSPPLRGASARRVAARAQRLGVPRYAVDGQTTNGGRDIDHAPHGTHDRLEDWVQSGVCCF